MWAWEVWWGVNGSGPRTHHGKASYTASSGHVGVGDYSAPLSQGSLPPHRGLAASAHPGG